MQVKLDERQLEERTQQIGAVLNFLGIDGLISPAARWDCKNATLFADNHTLHERLETVSSTQIDWQNWARDHGLLED